VIAALPVDPPKQATGVALKLDKSNREGVVMVKFRINEHPAASVTVQE
jgi:hypothetical protein